MFCLINWLVKKLLAKLGWVKAGHSRDNCGLTVPNKRESEATIRCACELASIELAKHGNPGIFL